MSEIQVPISQPLQPADSLPIVPVRLPDEQLAKKYENRFFGKSALEALAQRIKEHSDMEIEFDMAGYEAADNSPASPISSENLMFIPRAFTIVKKGNIYPHARKLLTMQNLDALLQSQTEGKPLARLLGRQEFVKGYKDDQDTSGWNTLFVNPPAENQNTSSILKSPIPTGIQAALFTLLNPNWKQEKAICLTSTVGSEKPNSHFSIGGVADGLSIPTFDYHPSSVSQINRVHQLYTKPLTVVR